MQFYKCKVTKMRILTKILSLQKRCESTKLVFITLQKFATKGITKEYNSDYSNLNKIVFRFTVQTYISCMSFCCGRYIKSS